MKFADRLKFTASMSAGVITFGAAVTGCRTLAQAIADGALAVGDPGVPFCVDDGAGNWEDGLYTVTSTTQLTRTSVLSSSAGGTTPATFAGASLTVFNTVPASLASKLMTALTNASGDAVGLAGPNGKDFVVVSSSAPNNSDGRPDGTIYFQTV